MVKMMPSILGLGLFMALGCCSDNKNSSNNGLDKTTSRLPSFLVDQPTDLPTCDDIQKGTLAYAKAESKFYTCTDDAWTTIEIKGDKGGKGDTGLAGNDGLSIASIWRFHTDSYIGANNLCLKGGMVYIGTVQLVQFSSGSAFISIDGDIQTVDSHLDQAAAPFHNSFFLAKSTLEQAYIAKLDVYLGKRIRYKITLGSNPTLIII